MQRFGFTRFTGKQYLMIDIASQFGLDKKNWSERLDWFESNKSQLHSLVKAAAEPAMFYAGILAWEATLRGEPTGYAISLDATASGLQILAILTGDRLAASICNVINATGNREDAYTAIYQNILAKLGAGATISREQIKDAVMTGFYGSTNVPKRVFGEGEQLAAFFETMGEMAPEPWGLKDFLIQKWDPTALTHEWVMPDNFHVKIKVNCKVVETVQFLNMPFEVVREINAPTETGRSLPANLAHAVDGMIVREMARRCSYDPAWIQVVRDLLVGDSLHEFKAEDAQEALRMTDILWTHYETTGYLSARILDYIDIHTIQLVDPEAILDLIDSLPVKPFPLLAIHDCFRCGANYGNDLREQYILQLHLIAKSTLLNSILSQLLKTPINAPKADPGLADDILGTEYALS